MASVSSPSTRFRRHCVIGKIQPVHVRDGRVQLQVSSTPLLVTAD
jgi:hypothetical protein